MKIESLDGSLAIVCDRYEKAITETAMFMAAGVNTANASGNLDYNLRGVIKLVPAPDTLPDEGMRALKTGYSMWIVGNGFRDMLAHLEGFLNFVHKLIQVAEEHLQQIGYHERKKQRRKFECLGVSRKFEHLRKRYGFEASTTKYFDGITRARNCMTHRHGMVHEEDCNEEGSFVFEWLGIDVKVVAADGTVHIIDLDTEGPISSERYGDGKEAQLQATLVDKSLRTELGAPIIIPPRELEEICSMFRYTCFKYHEQVANWMVKQGLPVKPIEDPTASIELVASLTPE